jgi:hypothetical protein
VCSLRACRALKLPMKNRKVSLTKLIRQVGHASAPMQMPQPSTSRASKPNGSRFLERDTVNSLKENSQIPDKRDKWLGNSCDINRQRKRQCPQMNAKTATFPATSNVPNAIKKVSTAIPSNAQNFSERQVNQEEQDGGTKCLGLHRGQPACLIKAKCAWP